MPTFQEQLAPIDEKPIELVSEDDLKTVRHAYAEGYLTKEQEARYLPLLGEQNAVEAKIERPRRGRKAKQ